MTLFWGSARTLGNSPRDSPLDQGWFSNEKTYPEIAGICSIFKRGGFKTNSSLNLVEFVVLMVSSVKMNPPLFNPLLSAPGYAEIVRSRFLGGPS